MLDVEELLQFHTDAIPYFQGKWEKGEENEHYKEVNHWWDKKEEIESQGRQAYSIGLISGKVNQILAEQRMNRTEYKLRAKADPADEIKAEIGTIQYNDLESRADMKYIDTDVFDSGAAVCYGAYEIFLDTDEELNQVPNVRKVDYKNFMWDKNSVDYTHNDALWMAKKHYAYRYQIAKEHGKEKAKKIAEGDTYNLWGRVKDSYFIQSGETPDYDILTVFNHYQKVVRKYHYVLFNDYMNIHGLAGKKVAYVTRNKKEAQQVLRQLKYPYLANRYPVGANSIESRDKTKIDKYIFTVENILEHEETDMDMFPFAIYHGYQYADKFWTITDVLKSAQVFIDRYLAQIDYSFGKDIKNAYELVVNKLAEGFTYETALQRLEEDGVLPVKSENALNQVRSQSVNPQWIQMVGLMQSYLEDLAGGRSFQGISESADESGRAIKLKQMQGQKIAGLLADNLKRTRLDLGKKLLWWFKKYDTSERVVKIAGESLTPQMKQFLENNGALTSSQIEENAGYVKINPGGTSHLLNAKLELEVAETAYSESERQKKLNELMAAAEMNPQIAQIPKFNELALKYIDVSFNDRQELISSYQNLLQSQAEAAEKEQTREDAKLNIDKAKVLADLEKNDATNQQRSSKEKKND